MSEKGIQKRFTDKEKMEAAAQLYITGCSRKAARKLPFDIAARTIRGWAQNNPDFQDKFKQLVADNTQESMAKFRVIISTGLDALTDRIEHGNIKVVAGDVVVAEDGTKSVETIEYREPMTSKDLTYSMGITFDKYSLSLGRATRITQTNTNEDALLDQFKAIYDKFGPPVIDVTPRVEKDS